jgi:hypothetical protein
VHSNNNLAGERFRMSRHTKGPWHVEKKDRFYAIYSESVPLGIVSPKFLKDKYAAGSNANLMATAPQLLDTLKTVLEHLDNCMIVTCDGFKVNDCDLRKSISDAIMKAQGYRI